MRIEPSLVRIRAVITAAAINLSVAASVISRTVVVPYIKFRHVLGHFFKYSTLADEVFLRDVAPYVDDGYIDSGYFEVSFYISFGKATNDSITTSDNNIIFGVSTTVNETVYSIGTFSYALSGFISAILDNVSAADEGSLQMQDYCDTTYFAEVYVGVSRTFS